MYNKQQKKIKDNVYLYSINNGRLTVRNGKLYNAGLCRCSFKTEEKSIIVSSIPKEIVNGMLWMEERNDDAARKIFFKYLKERIILTTTTLDNYEIKLDYLQKGGIDDCCTL